MKRITPVLLTLSLLFGGLMALPEAQATIKRGVNMVGDGALLYFGGTTSSYPALKRSSTNVEFRTADDASYASAIMNSLTAVSLIRIGASVILVSATAPTISSGFGTSPSIVANNGTAAFTVNVGTGGVATSGVIGLPTATTGWNCFVIDRTNNTVTRETATTTTSATLTAAAAWAASDILQVSCFGY